MIALFNYSTPVGQWFYFIFVPSIIVFVDTLVLIFIILKLMWSEE